MPLFWHLSSMKQSELFVGVNQDLTIGASIAKSLTAIFSSIPAVTSFFSICRSRVCSKNFLKSAPALSATALPSNCRPVLATSTPPAFAIQPTSQTTPAVCRPRTPNHRQRMKKCPASVQRPPAYHALGKIRQITHQPGHPQIEVRNRHPDIGATQSAKTESASRKTASLASRSGSNSSSNSATCPSATARK